MSFNSANLTVFIPPYGPGNAVARYTTTDNISPVLAAGYFASAGPMLRQGDSILVEAADATWLCQVVSFDLTNGPIIYNGIHVT